MQKLQQGSVLIVSLILLLLLTLVGVAGMNMTGLEERMSGNYKDQEMAFQAAEAALVEAENYIENTNLTLDSFYTNDGVALCSGADCFKRDCTGGADGGLCFMGDFETSSEPVNSCSVVASEGTAPDPLNPWESLTRWDTPAQVEEAAALDGNSAVARYIIEFRCFTVRDDSNSTADATVLSQWSMLFRITALANGGSGDSRVMLQSTYKKLDF